MQALDKISERSSRGSDRRGDTETNSDLEIDQCVMNGGEEEPHIKTTLDVKGRENDLMIVDKPLMKGPFTAKIEKEASQPLLKSSPKRSNSEVKDEEDDDEEPVKKRLRRREPTEKPNKSAKETDTQKPAKSAKTRSVGSKPLTVEQEPKVTIVKQNDLKKVSTSAAMTGSRQSKEPDDDKITLRKATKGVQTVDEPLIENDASEIDEEEAESDEDEEEPEVAAKAREKVQSTLNSNGKDPYPDWAPGEPVPYAALCTTFSLVEMTTKRLIISAHCSLFLRQVLRLTPQDLLPTIQLMINKLAADYAGIELGIGESLIMKAIGESTGRSLQIIKADQNEIGDLGLVAAKSRSNQPTMFKPKPLTVRGVLDGLMNIAIIQGDGSQGRKVAGIKKLLSAADAATAGKGGKGIDITKDKGGASEAKFIIRFLEGKLRLGLAEKTVLVALAHAMVIHETEKKGNRLPTSEQLANGESILKTVYR